MNRREIFKQAVEILKSAGVPAPKTDAELIISHILRIKRIEIHTDWNEQVNDNDREKILKLIHRRSKREPIAYILGYKHFYGLKFEVKKGVLIPRPETETLIEAVRKRLIPQKILDIGTGSGAIIIALLHIFRNASGIGFDLSREAVETARKNATNLLQSPERVKIVQGNIFDDWNRFVCGKFDLIVSNPPYIKSREIDTFTLEPELYYEPRTALDGGKDGLDFYREIADKVPQFADDNCWLFLEVSGILAGEVLKIIKSITDSAGMIKDISGEYRVVFGRVAKM